MRYFPMILVAGLLLSVGLLAGSGPATPPCPRSRWIVPLSRTRQLKRLPTTTDTPGDIIAVTITAMAIAMATTGPTTATATAGPIILWLWASLALLRGRYTHLNSRVKSKPVATSARSFSAAGSARRETRLASSARGRVSCVRQSTPARAPWCLLPAKLGRATHCLQYRCGV